MTIQFNVTGPERKKLVTTIGEVLCEDVNYKGAPTFAYEVGEYRIDKTGTVTGPDNRELIAALAEPHGFVAIIGEYDQRDAGLNVAHGAGQEETHHVLRPQTPLDATSRCRRDPIGEDGPQASDVPECDEIVIEVSLDGFTSEAIDNLRKLVLSKEVLIKKALGAEELPIEVLEDRIAFPWFKLNTDDGSVDAYAGFITALCKTAKEKKRVTAKAQESFENEKFAMRVWMIGLGMIGKEFALARKLLMANLGGNSGWRYGAPDRAAAAGEPTTATDTTPADEPATAPTEAATAPDTLAEALADAALIHAVNESFDNDSEAEAQGDE